MGQHYFSTKEIDKAEQEHEQAICMRPYLPGLHLEVGQIYSSNSEWPKAEELFRQEHNFSQAMPKRSFVWVTL